MNRLTVLLLISLPSICFAQNITGYFIIEDIKAEKSNSYHVPLIKEEGAPIVSDKINQAIQLIMIGKSYSVAGKEVFSELQDDQGYGMTSLSYEILQNSKAVLSIRFTDETLAAYPDYHTTILNFNSSTGDLLELSSVLTAAGIEHLNDLASTYFNDQIEQNHKGLLEENGITEDERKEMFEYIFDLTECNATHKILKFGIADKTLIVEKDRCFPHVIQAFDISWSSEIKIEALFDQDFTLLGKNLLETKIQDFSKVQTFQDYALVYGKIGDKYPFTMYLRKYSDGLDGYYWYNKFGKVIRVKGTHKSDEITLKEASGMFILKFNEQGIAGEWKDNAGKSYAISFY